MGASYMFDLVILRVRNYYGDGGEFMQSRGKLFSRVVSGVVIGIASVGVGVVLSTPASAANPCAARAQIVFSTDYMRAEDPAIGCAQLAMNMEYWAGGQAMTTTARHWDLVQGNYYVTYKRPEASRGRACSAQSYVVANCTYTSGWWSSAPWNTFG